MESAREVEVSTLREAFGDLVGREVQLTVTWAREPDAVVLLCGRFEGLTPVFGGSAGPMSIVVAGQNVALWPEDLSMAELRRAPDGSGATLVTPSGLAVHVDLPPGNASTS